MGDKITLNLMRKERDSLYVRPKSEWRANQSDNLYGVEGECYHIIKYSGRRVCKHMPCSYRWNMF